MGGRPSVRCQGAPLLSMRMPCCHGAATPGICLIIAFSAPVPMVSGPCAAGPTPRADGPGAHGGDGGDDFLSFSLQLPSGYPWHRIRRNIPKQPHHPHYLQRCRLVKPADGGGCCQATREHQSCPGKRGEPLHGLFGRRQGHPCPRLPPPPPSDGTLFLLLLFSSASHNLSSFGLLRPSSGPLDGRACPSAGVAVVQGSRAEKRGLKAQNGAPSKRTLLLSLLS